MQIYSDPKRQNDPNALPDVEVFYIPVLHNTDAWQGEPGWYYWHCFPGCLPDGEAVGPFETVEHAIIAAQERDE